MEKKTWSFVYPRDDLGEHFGRARELAIAEAVELFDEAAHVLEFGKELDLPDPRRLN